MKIHIVCPVDQIPESNNALREDEMFGNMKSIAYLSFHSTRFRNVTSDRERVTCWILMLWVVSRILPTGMNTCSWLFLRISVSSPAKYNNTFHNLVCEASSKSCPDLVTFTYLLEWLHISDPYIDRDTKSCKQ